MGVVKMVVYSNDSKPRHSRVGKRREGNDADAEFTSDGASSGDNLVARSQMTPPLHHHSLTVTSELHNLTRNILCLCAGQLWPQEECGDIVLNFTTKVISKQKFDVVLSRYFIFDANFLHYIDNEAVYAFVHVMFVIHTTPLYLILDENQKKEDAGVPEFFASDEMPITQLVIF